MCQVISVVVHPTTMEVFSSPGVWHHTEICANHGLDYDKVFKPEILIWNKQIEFPDGPIAISRQVPQELLQDLLLKLDLKGEGMKVLCDLKISHEWTKEHHNATMRWFEKNAGIPKQLLGFSEHTFEPTSYTKTISRQTWIGEKFHQAMGSSNWITGTPEDKIASMKRALWQKVFSQPENRVLCWR